MDATLVGDVVMSNVRSQDAASDLFGDDLPMTDYHMRSLALADEIERTYPVTRWHIGDVPVWPLARWALHHNVYLQSLGLSDRPKPNPSRRARLASRATRAASSAL